MEINDTCAAAAYVALMSDVTIIHGGKTPNRIHYLNEWLEKRGLKQVDIVRALGADKGTVSKWVNGGLPQESSVLAIAELLQIEPNALFRHPDDDWIARMFRERSDEERNRMVETLKIAFPYRDGTNG